MLVPSDEQRKYLASATENYALQMKASLGEEYLEQRGITSETIEAFSLGFVSEPEIGHEAFAGSISLPYCTRSGVVGIRFRSVPPAQKIYWTTSGNEARLYNTRVLEKARKIVVCEGELDTVVATQCGLQAVGVPGVSSWKDIWNRAFRFREIYILADNDDDGQGLEFAKKLAKKIDNCRIVTVPSGHDVNSFYLEAGAEGVRRLVGLE